MTTAGRLLPSFGEGFSPQGRVTVPTGCARFENRFDRRHFERHYPDLRVQSGPAQRGDANERYNVVHATDMPRGGHFAALEQPKLWLDDIRIFFRGRL